MKWGVAIAFAVGLVAAAWLIWAIGFDAVIGSVARAGFTGLAILCLYALLLTLPLAAAWVALLPQDQRHGVKNFYLARLVRDCITEISPFSPVGGMVAAARLVILHGMSAGYAAASVAAARAEAGRCHASSMASRSLLVKSGSSSETTRQAPGNSALSPANLAS